MEKKSRLDIYPEVRLLKALDLWRGRQEPIPSRAEAVRMLVWMALKVEGVASQEREDVIATLRRVCADHGDNDWPDDLELTDIVEKHLAGYLSLTSVR